MIWQLYFGFASIVSEKGGKAVALNRNLVSPFETTVPVRTA